MLYLIAKVLDETEINSIRKEVMSSIDWIDGNSSANYRLSNIKKNLQLNGDRTIKAQDTIIDKLRTSKTVNDFSFIKKIHSLMFSRTGEGMYYKSHLDKPTLEAGRRDLSFTLFLSDPEAYEGGELRISIPPEIKTVKLKPGEIIIYPTQYVHEVRTVTQGERLVSVGWIESEIPENENRYILGLINKAQRKIQRENDEGAKNQEALSNIGTAYNMLYKRYYG